eukprot:m.176136 g.176136  ORF g.176136 m.176136 type:complete len:191 (-) comp14116_c0_seq1:112-684(-)
MSGSQETWARSSTSHLHRKAAAVGHTADAREKVEGFGHHCTTCRELDFLAVRCACDAWFCHNDFFQHRTQCSVAVAKMRQPRPTPSTAHTGSADSNGTTTKAHTKPSASKRKARCKHTGCRKPIGLVSHTCSQCEHSFCMTHRHASDHDCGTLQRQSRASARQSCAGAAAMERARQKGQRVYQYSPIAVQ